MKSLVSHVLMIGLDSENNWEVKRKSHGLVCVLKGPSGCWWGNGWELEGFAAFQVKDDSASPGGQAVAKRMDNSGQDWWLMGHSWHDMVDMTGDCFDESGERETRSQDGAWFWLGQLTEFVADKYHGRRIWFAAGNDEFISGYVEFEVPGINSLHLLVFSKVCSPCEITGIDKLI